MRQNLELPGGRVDQGAREMVLRTMGRVERPADFADLIVANRNGQPVRIEDIGRVEDSFEEPRGLSRLWVKEQAEGWTAIGDNAVSLVVQKQSGSNTVEVVDTVQAAVGEAQAAAAGRHRHFEVIRDQSRFIRARSRRSSSTWCWPPCWSA